MMILPVAELALRATLSTGIPGLSIIVQHLLLVVSMLGAGVAARDDRLLTLSTATVLAGTRLRPFARLFSNTIGAAVTIGLAIAGVQFVVAERDGGSTDRGSSR